MDSLRAKRVIDLLSDPHKLLITILVGNTIVNIAAASIMAESFYSIFGEAGVGISIAAMAFILLVFGEVTPKMLALETAVNVTFFAAAPLKIIEKILAPVRHVLGGVSGLIVRSLGVKIGPSRPRVTEQEIKSLFSMGRKKGVVKKKEKDMVEGILALKDSNVADIMTPRIHMAALDLTGEREDIVREIKSDKFSRYPVYIHTIDNIVGILHAKDAFLDVSRQIRDVVRKPFVVPESMKLDVLLQELRKNHTHMAVVTDEYGVTSGVVTIEDILEEIVGEIRDELDHETPKIKMVDQTAYEVNGQAHIDEVNEELGLRIDTDQVDTIGGYIILRLGRIPRTGDSIEVGDFNANVRDVSKNRVTKVDFVKKDKKDLKDPGEG